MRIVLTSNFSPWSAYAGGGQRSTHELATALSRLGHDVHVVFTRPLWEKFETPSTEYTLHWAAFFDWRSRRQAPLRPLNAFSVLGCVRRLHTLSKLDVVHGNGEEVVLTARFARAAGVPVVVTPRYPTYPDALLKPGGPTPLERLALVLLHSKYLVLKRALGYANYCCATSAYSADQVSRALGVDRARLEVVPNGVAPAFFERRWADAEGPRKLLFFGRLARDKGLDVLLRALAELTSPVELLVAGRGDAEPSLRRLASELGLAERIEWRPWLSESELAHELARCQMAVLPSRHESFGNAMAEAMAVGAPLVSTRAGSIPEVVADGVTGLLVPPDTPGALARAIERLSNDTELRQRFSEAGRARVLGHYSWESVARRYLGLYAAAQVPQTQTTAR